MAVVAGIVPIRPEEVETMGWMTSEEAILKREAKSMSKAEKILGVSDSSGWHSQKNATEGRKKFLRKGNNLGFAFSTLRGALIGAHKQSSGNWTLGRQATFRTLTTDSDSTASNPSPTFDPTASTSTLPSAYSSPVTPKVKQHFATYHFQEPGPSQDNLVIKTLRARNASGAEMPPIAENRAGFKDHEHRERYELPALELPPLSASLNDRKGSLLRHSLSRNRSVASVNSVSSDSTSKGRWLSRKGSEPNGQSQPTSSRAATRKTGAKNGKHIQEWLESADLNRSPSIVGRPLPRPQDAFYKLKRNAFTSRSSCTSIRTLTSQPESTEALDSPESPWSQWPLPATSFNVGDKDSLKRARFGKVFKSDLQIESILSLSSDEESDNEHDPTHKLRKSRNIGKLGTVREVALVSDGGPGVDDSAVSDINATISQHVTQTRPAKLPSSFAKPAATGRFPKRTFVDAADASVGTRRAPFSAAEWQHNDETELTLKALAAADQGHLVRSQDIVRTQAPTAMPWGVFRDEGASRAGSTLGMEASAPSTLGLDISSFSEGRKDAQSSTSPQYDTIDVEESDIVEEELDVSNFPVPPHSRSNSTVPIIQVEFMDDAQQRESRPPIPNVQNDLATLLTTSTSSKAGSTNSDVSTISSKSSTDLLPLQPPELPGMEVRSAVQCFDFGLSLKNGVGKERLTRTKTISNVPIYVTGLEEGSGADSDATFVFSNLY